MVPSVIIITFFDGAIKESRDTVQNEELFPKQVLVYT